MQGSRLLEFAYPLLQVKNASDTTFHNLIIQVLFLGLTIVTLVMALDHDGERTLVSLKVMQMVFLLGVVIFTGVALARQSRKREELRGFVSQSSLQAATVVLFVSASTMVSGADRGTLWWLELIMTLLSALWLWRTTGQKK